MHNLKSIRVWLGVTQEELGNGIGCTQGNVGHYERGQTLLPDVARKVIEFAATKGLHLDFNHIYGNKELQEKMQSPSTIAQPATENVAQGE